MFTDLITHIKYNGQIEVCKAAFYYRQCLVGMDIETGRYNIFGQKLENIERPIYRQDKFLLGGEGVTTFKTQQDLNKFLKSIDFKGQLYSSELIHKKIG